MTIYSVFQSPGIDDDEAVPAVVPERFSWFAAILPPVYALVHGLWLSLGLYIVAVIILALIATLVGEDATTWLYIILAIAIGFEAPALRRAKLARRGWIYTSDVVAAGSDLAVLEGMKLGKTF